MAVRGRVATVVCYVAMMSLAISINLLPVFLTTLGAEFNLNKEQLGRINAVTFLGLVTAIFVTGPTVDRFSARTGRAAKAAAILGNLLIGAGLVLLARAPSYGQVLVGVYIMGIGSGTLDIVLSPIVAVLAPEKRTTAMNLLHSFYAIGAAVSILAGALALEFGLGWRGLSGWMVLLPLAVVAGYLPLKIPALVHPDETRTPLRELFKQRYFAWALWAIFLGGAAELAMAYWLPTYAERDLKFSRFTADMSFLAFNVAMAVGRLAIGFLGARFHALTLMTWCAVTSLILFLMASFFPHPPTQLVACVLAGLAGSALWPSTLAVAADRYPHGGATMFGVLAAFGNLGGIFMPWMAGIVADHATLALGLATSALCPLLILPAIAGLKGERGGVGVGVPAQGPGLNG